MRETPSKLAATLLTLCSLALIGPPAQALASGGRHHGQSTRLHHKLRHARHHSRRHTGNGGTRAGAGHTLHQRSHRLASHRIRNTERLARRNAEQGAAVIASVLATPCQNTEITPTSANIAIVRDAVLCLINRVRAEHQLAPLHANGDLEEAAEGHCSELIADDYFAHVSPSGETPVDRIKTTGYIPNSSVGYVIGENLAWGTYSLSTPQAIVQAWVASPGHLANILESQYTETGIGITAAVPPSLGEGNPGATYAQEFGVIIH